MLLYLCTHFQIFSAAKIRMVLLSVIVCVYTSG